MIWPWERHRAEADEARRREALARMANEDAELRRQKAMRVAVHSRAMTATMQSATAKNGFTEILETMMGGRRK